MKILPTAIFSVILFTTTFAAAIGLLYWNQHNADVSASNTLSPASNNTVALLDDPNSDSIDNYSTDIETDSREINAFDEDNHDQDSDFTHNHTEPDNSFSDSASYDDTYDYEAGKNNNAYYGNSPDIYSSTQMSSDDFNQPDYGSDNQVRTINLSSGTNNTSTNNNTSQNAANSVISQVNSSEITIIGTPEIETERTYEKTITSESKIECSAADQNC